MKELCNCNKGYEQALLFEDINAMSLFSFGAYDVFQHGVRVDCGASAQDMTLCLDREGSLFCSFLPKLKFWFKSRQFVCFCLIDS